MSSCRSLYSSCTEENELISYHAYPQQFVSYHSKLGQDNEHRDTKEEGSNWIAQLQQSNFERIKKR